MDAVEDIKSRLSIEDVVSQYLELKRAGRNFKALSPFSNEKSPSLMISPEKQIWHDFSSGKGGDMFSFVMEVDGLDFKGALDVLARQAGIDLSQYQKKGDGRSAKLKAEVYEALELAAKYYQLCFSSIKSTLAYVSYVRQFTPQTTETFRLGYAPNTGDALLQFLRNKGFSEDVIKQAGLGTKRYRGFGDMFRDRLMIPLQDSTGRVIGFTARQLQNDANGPKYINTPQSPVYDKSRHVYGLHLAKDTMRKVDYAVVVEGNLDVVSSHQAGVLNVVATAGTALTESHLKEISRFTSDIRLAFDQDKAGLNATERAIPIASKVGVSLSMITVPEGKDPDELVKKNPQAWVEAVEHNQYAVDWIIERYQQLLDITSATGKRTFSDKVLAVVENLSDPVEKDHYIVKIAQLLGVDAAALRTKTGQMQAAAKPKVVEPKKATNTKAFDSAAAGSIEVQNKILALGLMLPSLRPYLEPLTRDMLALEEAKTLLDFLKTQPDFAYGEGGELPKIGDYDKVLSLLYEALYQDLEVLELRYEAARLQIRLIDSYVKTQKARLARAMQSANETDMERLLEAAKRLDVLLKSTKETTK